MESNIESQLICLDVNEPCIKELQVFILADQLEWTEQQDFQMKQWD